MWDSETERIGFMKCTPNGYRFLLLGDWFWLSVIVVPILLIGLNAFGVLAIQPAYFWCIPVSAVLAIASKTVAGWMASRRNYHYDYDARRTTWGMDGASSFTFEDWERDYKPILLGTQRAEPSDATEDAS